MSYILEALRKAQAERERGQVPGLNAQPAAMAAPAQHGGAPRWRLAWGLATAAAVALAVAALLWRQAGTPPPTAALPGPMAQGSASTAALPAPPPTAVLPLPVVVSLPAPAPAQPPPAAAAAARQAPPADRAVPIGELAPEQRRELPPLAMGGSIWSENALSRFVIVNGQVVREGEAAAAGVVVERIGPKSVVLRWRGRLLEVPI